MSLRHYAFEHAAVLPAPVAEVAETLLDLEHYPEWWPQVRAVASLGPDDALVVCRSVLPYDLELQLTAVSRSPERLEVAIDGPIHGFARWELTPTGPHSGAGTQMSFTQEVEASGALAAASYAARPLLVLNHRMMMRGCVRGLKQRLASR